MLKRTDWQTNANTPRVSAATLGMLIGSGLGAIVGGVLFSLTGEALYLAITGIGAGMGLSLGSTFPLHRKNT